MTNLEAQDLYSTIEKVRGFIEETKSIDTVIGCTAVLDMVNKIIEEKSNENVVQ